MQKKQIFYFKVLDSTMNMAEKLAEKNCPNYTVVVTKQQTLGRGRMDRLWYSELGGLYFSIIVRPNIPVDLGSLIGFAAAINIVNSIKELFNIEAKVKWPNDILVKNRKICGILSNAKIYNNKIVYVNVGIGLNVNNNSNLYNVNGISLVEILDREVSCKKILLTFLNLFELNLNNFDAKNIIEHWKLLNVTLGKSIKIVTLKEHIKGIANKINLDGSLEVIMADDSKKTILYGDCFHS